MKSDDPKAFDEIFISKKCAWLYYVGRLNQNQIAKKVGLSKMRVHRLIAFAEKKGFVKTFVEGGRKSKVLTLEESINSFDLQHVESMISSYKIKLAKVDSNIKENKSWVSRIKFELVLLESRKRELLK